MFLKIMRTVAHPSEPHTEPVLNTGSTGIKPEKSSGWDLFRRLFRILTVVAAMPVGIACAQSISITPSGYVTADLNGTVQFTATVTGLTNTKVNWYAGGTLGGNTTAGKISTSGLYTAPKTVPAQDPVTIKAVSQANSKVSAIVYVTVLDPGPKLTSVTPNPLSVGNITVTLVGTGFKQYASVSDTYGGKTYQLSTTSITSTKIVATGTQGAATSASFTVTNPGSSASNAVVVPVSGPKTYTLTVNSGSGGGSYAAGKVVTITANAPPTGKVFLNWTGATVANATSATTTITMPAANTTVTANYTTSTKYTLTVNNGTGSGSYTAGTVVSISANAPPAGQVFSNWSGGTVANPNASSTTITMPAAATTVTANYKTNTTTYVLTVNSGSGSGSYTAGTVVTIAANAPPPNEAFSNWTGATVADPNASTTTITMPAAAATVTANYTAAQQVPFPVTTHPRVWITTADLARLRSWAVPSNPIYQQGIVPLLATAVNNYETQFFPNGVANSTYPDLGDTQGYTGLLSEENGFVLAFNSLIDPVPANRIKYAKYTRNLLMYAMNQAAKGVLADAPFRDPAFPIYNRGDLCGHQWALMTDWIYNTVDENNQPILSSSDKATIRKVFMIWANECLNASTTGGDHPEPIGTINDLSLINGGAAPYRMASNNYYLGHARNLTMYSLSIDPVDDPVLDASKSPATIGNTLRSYILDATGAWLYQTYAMMGDPQQVAADYGLTGNGAGFGLASGGLPPEGMLYGESYGTLLGQLLALQTAGFNNTALSGPQIKLISAPVWDRFVTGFMSSITPTGKVDSSATYLGPLYLLAAFGDVLENYVTPDLMQPFALLSILEQQQGKTTHLNADRWFTTNVVQGDLLYNVSTPWTWGTAQSIFYYMLLDPSAAPATDPRPSFPLNWFDPLTGRVLAHSDWSSNPTWFDYRASWESINHQQGDAGEFELFRKGEWLTKEMSNYDNNLVGFTPYYLNSLCLKNWCSNGTPNLGWDETGIWANGGQWMWGGNAGDPTTISSNGTGYTYASSDLTNLYNRPNQWTPGDNATDITQATRSILWLNNDYVVVYDRATSIHSGLPKTFNLSLATSPVINGKVATETMADGQQLFIQTLLPQNATLTSRLAANDLSPHSEMDPMFYVLTVQDPTAPTDTRFLHVLQGSDPATQMVNATYVTNASGTSFDGAVFGSSAVFFPTKSNATIGVTTFVVPSTVHTFVVAGLAANGSYKVTTQTGANGTTVTLTPGSTGSVADAAGLLKVAI